MTDRSDSERRVDTPEDRYMRDPVFHHFVDAVEQLLHQAQMTPTEVREATMLACIHYDLRHVRRPIFRVMDEARGKLEWIGHITGEGSCLEPEQMVAEVHRLATEKERGMADFKPRKSIFGFPVEKDTEIADLRRQLEEAKEDLRQARLAVARGDRLFMGIQARHDRLREAARPYAIGECRTEMIEEYVIVKHGDQGRLRTALAEGEKDG